MSIDASPDSGPVADTARPKELRCRHRWSLWIKGVSALPAGVEGAGHPAATFRSNCSRCRLFRVFVLPDGGEEPGRHQRCTRCELPVDDPPGTLRWPTDIAACSCGSTGTAMGVTHDEVACSLQRTCSACGATARFRLGP